MVSGIQLNCIDMDGHRRDNGVLSYISTRAVLIRLKYQDLCEVKQGAARDGCLESLTKWSTEAETGVSRRAVTAKDGQLMSN